MPQAEAPHQIEALIDLMARLPGLGPRSARRSRCPPRATGPGWERPLDEPKSMTTAPARDEV